jgi:uncharacterized phage-associated protein
MSYSAKAIANFFLEQAKAEGKAIDPMKIQKLVYFAHGFYAGNKGEPLVNEDAEAWPWGPVFPSLYHAFKKFGNGPITKEASDERVEGLTYFIEPVQAPQDPELVAYLKAFWNRYSPYTGIQLSNSSHAAGSPWDETKKRVESEGAPSVIPFERIKAYFQDLVADSVPEGS